MDAQLLPRRTSLLLLVGVACGAPGGEEPPIYEPACRLPLNQVHSALDSEPSCPDLPQRVLCQRTKTRGDDILRERYSYRGDGRVVQGQFTARGETQIANQHYEDDRLVLSEGNISEQFIYDDDGRLLRTETDFRIRTLFYDEFDRLERVHLDFKDGYGITRHFTWGERGGLAEVISHGEIPGVAPFLYGERFEIDMQGRLLSHLLLNHNDVTEPLFQLVYRYSGDDVVRSHGQTVRYEETPLDTPALAGPQRALSLGGLQGEHFIRTGSPGRPWRVYLGDAPARLTEAFPEYHPAHRVSSWGDRKFMYADEGPDAPLTVTTNEGETLVFDQPLGCDAP